MNMGRKNQARLVHHLSHVYENANSENKWQTYHGVHGTQKDTDYRDCSGVTDEGANFMRKCWATSAAMALEKVGY